MMNFKYRVNSQGTFAVDKMEALEKIDNERKQEQFNYPNSANLLMADKNQNENEVTAVVF